MFHWGSISNEILFRRVVLKVAVAVSQRINTTMLFQLTKKLPNLELSIDCLEQVLRDT